MCNCITFQPSCFFFVKSRLYQLLDGLLKCKISHFGSLHNYKIQCGLLLSMIQDLLIACFKLNKKSMCIVLKNGNILNKVILLTKYGVGTSLGNKIAQIYFFKLIHSSWWSVFRVIIISTESAAILENYWKTILFHTVHHLVICSIKGFSSISVIRADEKRSESPLQL